MAAASDFSSSDTPPDTSSSQAKMTYWSDAQSVANFIIPIIYWIFSFGLCTVAFCILQICLASLVVFACKIKFQPSGPVIGPSAALMGCVVAATAFMTLANFVTSLTGAFIGLPQKTDNWYKDVWWFHSRIPVCVAIFEVPVVVIVSFVCFICTRCCSPSKIEEAKALESGELECGSPLEELRTTLPQSPSAITNIQFSIDPEDPLFKKIQA